MVIKPYVPRNVTLIPILSQKLPLKCFLQLPQHTAINSLNKTIPAFKLQTDECKVQNNLNVGQKWICTSEVNRPRQTAKHPSQSGSKVKNEWSYISTPPSAHISRYALARPLPPLCLTTYIISKASTFCPFSHHVSNQLYHKDERQFHWQFRPV